MLSSVQAIISQTLKDQPDVRNKLNARVIALATTNDLLVKSEWQRASVREIITKEFVPTVLPDVNCSVTMLSARQLLQCHCRLFFTS